MREQANRTKESGLAGNPTLAVRRDAATLHDAVRVRVMLEVLPPRVQDGGDADVGTELLAIGGNDGQGLGRSLKQESIDLGLVLEGNRVDRARKPEHQVKIRDRQELGFARRKPCRRSRPLAFGAVPVAAAIVGDAGVCTVLTALDMTAERRSATILDGRHNTSLGQV